MNVETIALDALVLDPANARKHPEQNLESIKGSLAKFGQQKPIVVGQGNVVIAGNGQLEAARMLGWKEMQIVRSDLRGSDATAFGIADNATGLSSEWDDERLASLIASLRAEDYETSALGLSQDELDAILADASASEGEEELKGDPDDIPDEADVETRCKPGDLWLLGEHRLLCGDSTKAADVARVMNGQKARMVFTDPPWNVAIGRDDHPSHRKRPAMANDDLPPAEFRAFIKKFSALMEAHVEGDIYCVLGASEWPTLDSVLRECGFHWSATIIWAKDSFVLGRSKYHRRYEPIWYGWSKKGKSSFGDDRTQDDVWEFPRPKRSDEHPTMKPVALVERAIANSSAKGDLLYEPFCGSGTTLIAAQASGRRCYGIELEPRYCDVILTRWEKLTGQTAKLESGGAD